jgi:hypothetical protein
METVIPAKHHLPRFLWCLQRFCNRCGSLWSWFYINPVPPCVFARSGRNSRGNGYYGLHGWFHEEGIHLQSKKGLDREDIQLSEK